MSSDRTDRDRQVWDEELSGFVPTRIFDVHVHLFDRSCLRPDYRFRPKSVFNKFGGAFTVEQLRAWADAWLPGRELHACQFGYPSTAADLETSAAYASRVADNRRFFGLALVAPDDDIETLRRRVLGNHLLGYKPYLDFVKDKPRDEVTIEDLMSAGQLRLANEFGLAIMLHIPRPGRLADPVNQIQMADLCRRYPDLTVIFAHIGRAYYRRNVVGFLDGIAACPNAYVDTAMVNHEGVLEHAFRNFPRDRIFFGSDAPVACLRGKSVEINNQYAYLMAEDYEIGTSIHDVSGAVEFTSFYYEQLRGIRLAAERAGLTPAEIEEIMFGNANRLFSAIATRNYPEATP